ncbi:hypothetical protein AWC38_SpisGene24786 [Stylophora pistillata]|uniref:Uncharacterized protein n=1 Tax=Stylophora pistillata TaxID=50429 RepID=A0A2B4R532_STYPI|nr:hypothetical protein AWC38_SpisGene24786 [Stylophora pistillata]
MQEARMEPSDGPLQREGIFRAEIDDELPPSMATGLALFGNESKKVRVTRDGLAMLGEEIPVVKSSCQKLPSLLVPCQVAVSRYKRSRDEVERQVEESVKRLRSETVSRYESDEFAGKGYQESGVTQVLKDQFVEEGYFADAETSDSEEASENEDSDPLVLPSSKEKKLAAVCPIKETFAEFSTKYLGMLGYFFSDADRSHSEFISFNLKNDTASDLVMRYYNNKFYVFVCLKQDNFDFPKSDNMKIKT